MGPRSLNRGNRALGIRPARNGRMLQWGRGLSTAEIQRPERDRRQPVELQWGRGLSTAEILRSLRGG